MFLLLVACSQIFLNIDNSMMKTTQKYMEKEPCLVWGSWGRQGGSVVL